MTIDLVYNNTVDLLECMLHGIFVASAGLDRRTLCNTRDPLHQVWKWLHILLGEARELPSFHPRPRANVRYGVFAFARAGKILSGLTSIFSRQTDLQHPIHA